MQKGGARERSVELVCSPRSWPIARYRHHIDYLNPLKHGLVTRITDWPYSSFHRAVRVGVYPSDWCGNPHINVRSRRRAACLQKEA